MKMKRWTRSIAWVVSGIMWLTQAAPVVSAHQYLRQTDTGESGVTQHEIRNDRTWAWGPGSQDLTQMGRANLVSLGRQVVGPAFEVTARAFPILGPHVRPIDELVEEYAARYPIFHDGQPLSDTGKTALKEKLEFIRAEAEQEFRNIQWAVTLRPGEPPVLLPATDVVRFVPVLNETGTPALKVQGVDGNPLHVALIAYGGQHRFDGWDQSVDHPVLDQPAADGSGTVRQQIGPKHIYVDLDQIAAMLAEAKQQREAGALSEKGKLTTLTPGEHEADARFSAATLLLHHEVNNLARGGFARDLSAEDEAVVNAAIGETFDSVKTAQAAKQAEYLKQRKAAAEKRAEQLAKRVQIVPYLVNLGRFFEGGNVPDYVIEEIRAKIATAIADGKIVDALVKRYNQHVLLEVHYNGADRNPAVDRLLVDLVADALSVPPPDTDLATGTKVPHVRLTTAYYEEVAGKSYDDRAKALRIRTGEFGLNVRNPEPLYVSVALDGGIAAYNWVIVRLLNEAVENQLKIEGIRSNELVTLKGEYEKYRQALESGNLDLAKDLEFNAENLGRLAELEGPGYVVVVESVADILAGKRDRTSYRFVFPAQGPYIHTLVDDQTEWVITKVLPRPGSRLYDPSKAPEDQDPILSVMVDQVGDAAQGRESFSPIFVAKQQSGAPAIGEYVSATTQFFLTTSGPGEGTSHRGVIPTTEAEADAGTFKNDGLVQMVSYTYMSSVDPRTGTVGRIPHEEIHDQVALSTDVKATRTDELWVHENLMLLGSFQPAVTAPEAERRAHHAVEQISNRYHEVPAVIVRNPDGTPKKDAADKPIVKLDPILQSSNDRQVLTISDLKADIGATGHQLPYKVMFAAFRASLSVAQEAGLIEGFDVANAGDDNHFIIFHKHGVDHPDIHALAFQTFFRAGWTAQKLGYQPYGLMQDFVDPNVLALIRAGKLDVYANLNDAFIAALEQELQAFPEGSGKTSVVRDAYAAFKDGKAAGKVQEFAPPGNVTGMGIGFAEKAISARELELFKQWSVIANDKGAAGAFNYPVYWAVRVATLMREVYREGGVGNAAKANIRARFAQEVAAAMLNVPEALRQRFVTSVLDAVADQVSSEDATTLANYLQHGVVFETWDVLPNSRAFVDADSENDVLRALLSAQNEHNIKRLWTKKRDGWISDLTADEVAAIETRVDGELPALRSEYEQRKAQLTAAVELNKQDAKKGRSLETMNPWERAIVGQSLDELLAAARPRLIELYKVQEFLGDDYMGSVSTEKLAKVTGGEYVGKDDSVMIVPDVFARLHRAIRKEVVGVNIGNARGSHWVAMRPESSGTVTAQIGQKAVAVKWSNPIEIALRYAVKTEVVPGVSVGTVAHVVTDAAGTVVREDMYGADFEAARERVTKFNEAWISSQGGFTPHGPNVMRDIEGAYPARKTLNMITASTSPFARPTTDTTVQTVEQGRWTTQYPQAAGYVVSKAVAGASADAAAPKWVVVHASVYEAPDAGMVHRQIQQQLKSVLNGGESALRFALVVDGVTSVEDAEKVAKAFLEAIPKASGGTVSLTRDDFVLVLPGLIAPGDLLGRLEAAVPGSSVASVIGPRDWTQAVRQASSSPQQIAAIVSEPSQEPARVASGARAIIAGVEAAATGGQLQPALAAKLDVQQDADLLVPTALDIAAEMQGSIQRYREQVKSAKATAVGG